MGGRDMGDEMKGGGGRGWRDTLSCAISSLDSM